MKKLILAAIGFSLTTPIAFAQNQQAERQNNFAACNKCNAVQNYSKNDSDTELAETDLSVETLDVTDNGTSLTATISILNRFDDTAQGVELIVLLPVNVKEITASVGNNPISYKRCGAQYKFCIGTLDKLKPLTVTVKTSKCFVTRWAGWESFGAFVSATTPDPCPINNYKGWVNTATANANLCKEYIPEMIKIGF